MICTCFDYVLDDKKIMRDPSVCGCVDVCEVVNRTIAQIGTDAMLENVKEHGCGAARAC